MAEVGALGLNQDSEFLCVSHVQLTARVLAADGEDEVRVGARLAGPSIPTLLVLGQRSDPNPAHRLGRIAIPIATWPRPAHWAVSRHFVLFACEFPNKEIRDCFLLETKNALRTGPFDVRAMVETVVVPGRADRCGEKVDKEIWSVGHVRIPPFGRYFWLLNSRVATN